MATPKERAQHKRHHRHGRKHPVSPEKKAHNERQRALHYGISAFGYTGGPAVPQTGHLSPEQFTGYPGGFSTNAGNYTGVEAIEGAAGNGGAGGDGDGGSGGGDGGSS